MSLRNGLLFALGLGFVVLTLADLLYQVKPVWRSGWLCVAMLLLNAAWFAISASKAADRFPWTSDYQHGFWANVIRDSLVAAQVALVLLAVSLLITEDGNIMSAVGNERPNTPWPLSLLWGRWAWIAAFLVAGALGNGLALIDSRAQTDVRVIESEITSPPRQLSDTELQLAAKYRRGWIWINWTTMACFGIGCVWALLAPRFSGTPFDFDRLIGYGALATAVAVGVVSWWTDVQ